jgi:hypothetical protein
MLGEAASITSTMSYWELLARRPLFVRRGKLRFVLCSEPFADHTKRVPRW